MATRSESIQMEPFPDIPEDIGRRILEELFEISSRSGRCKIVMLSRKVRLWIEPLLYRHVDLPGHAIFQAFLPVLISRPAFLCENVRSCYIMSAYWHPTYTSDILRTCKRIKHAVIRDIGSEHGLAHLISTSGSSKQLTSLVVSLRKFEETELTLAWPFYQNLTHLHWSFRLPSRSQPNRFPLGHLSSLGRLTHLFLNMVMRDLIVGGYYMWYSDVIAPQFPPSLHVAVIVCPQEGFTLNKEWFIQGCDDRIVFAQGDESALEDIGLEGLVIRNMTKEDQDDTCDYWALAEAALERRRLLALEARRST